MERIEWTRPLDYVAEKALCLYIKFQNRAISEFGRNGGANSNNRLQNYMETYVYRSDYMHSALGTVTMERLEWTRPFSLDYIA
jgi:hypothetical protein